MSSAAPLSRPWPSDLGPAVASEPFGVVGRRRAFEQRRHPQLHRFVPGPLDNDPKIGSLA